MVLWVNGFEAIGVETQVAMETVHKITKEKGEVQL